MAIFRLRKFPLHKRCYPLSLLLFGVCMMILTKWHTEFRTSSQNGRLGTPNPTIANTRNKHISGSSIDWLNPMPLLADLEQVDTNDSVPVSYAVHTFYYAWYNAPRKGQIPNRVRHWAHWNHIRLRHWSARFSGEFPTHPHNPPKDIASSFFPKLLPYASADEQVIRAHMRMLRFAGIGVMVLSWYPAGMADKAGEPMDHLVIPILNLANKYGIKVALHLEPYEDWTVHSLKSDLLYALRRNYTNHPAYYRLPAKQPQNDFNTDLPVFFVYDSYGISYADWKRILLHDGDLSIRGYPEDAYLIGLMMDTMDCKNFKTIGFNGGYTYFIGYRTTHASASSNWMMMSSECRQSGIAFFPSIGPGYDDISIRPWNDKSTVDREDGMHLYQMFMNVLKHRISAFGITSFNEWHEGTQIEPAAVSSDSTYMDYSPFSEEYYLRLVRVFVNRYANFHRVPFAFNLTSEYELEAVNQVLDRAVGTNE